MLEKGVLTGFHKLSGVKVSSAVLMVPILITMETCLFKIGTLMVALLNCDALSSVTLVTVGYEALPWRLR